MITEHYNMYDMCAAVVRISHMARPERIDIRVLMSKVNITQTTTTTKEV